MFNRIVAYSSHSAIAIVCIVSVVILIPQLWVPICAISVIISASFKSRCWGFYYNNREKINVEIIEIGPKYVRGKYEW